MPRLENDAQWYEFAGPHPDLNLFLGPWGFDQLHFYCPKKMSNSDTMTVIRSEWTGGTLVALQNCLDDLTDREWIAPVSNERCRRRRLTRWRRAFGPGLV